MGTVNSSPRFTRDDIRLLREHADLMDRYLTAPLHADLWSQRLAESGLSAELFFRAERAELVEPWLCLADRLEALVAATETRRAQRLGPIAAWLAGDA